MGVPCQKSVARIERRRKPPAQARRDAAVPRLAPSGVRWTGVLRWGTRNGRARCSGVRGELGRVDAADFPDLRHRLVRGDDGVDALLEARRDMHQVPSGKARVPLDE